ncbi:MAG: hypothetical protein MJ071_02945 [Oscillospiraceae bacterium]|nr:hypothetical protein [Oscillospiraceae bacterium]
MKQFAKYLSQCLLCLLLAEILCLVLAFSLALFPSAAVFRILRLILCPAASALMIMNCAGSIRHEEAARWRTAQQKMNKCHILLLSLSCGIPSILTYALLYCNADSVFYLNAFLLLNAPYIEFHHLLIAGMEPFSAIPFWQKAAMSLPSFLNMILFLVCYQANLPFHNEKKAPSA